MLMEFGSDPVLWHAFLHLPSTAYGLPAGMNALGTLGGRDSVATDINGSGQVVGGAQDTSMNMRPFLWLPSAAYSLSAGMNDLGTLGGDSQSLLHRAQAINSSGETVGLSFTAGGNAHAFLWLPSAAYGLSSGMNDLGVLTGGTISWAFAINDDGEVVGTSNVTGGAYHAFVWANGTMTDLNDLINADADWTLTRATSINSDGEITGWGTNQDGEYRAFVLTQTCALSTSGAVAGGPSLISLPPPPLESGSTITVQATVDENGDAVAVAENETQPFGAAVAITGGEPGATFELELAEVLTVETTEGFAAEHDPLVTLTASTDMEPGTYTALIEVFFDPSVLDGFDVAAWRLHRFDSASRQWQAAGVRDYGISAPVGGVGSLGVDLDTVTVWAVVDRFDTFAAGPAVMHDLTVAVAPKGAGWVVREPDFASHVWGTAVILTAIADDGFVFQGWTGDVTDEASTIEMIVDDSTVVRAQFRAVAAAPESAGPSEPEPSAAPQESPQATLPVLLGPLCGLLGLSELVCLLVGFRAMRRRRG